MRCLPDSSVLLVLFLSACACCWQRAANRRLDYDGYGTFDTLQRALDENVKPILRSPMKMIVSGSPKANGWELRLSKFAAIYLAAVK